MCVCVLFICKVLNRLNLHTIISCCFIGWLSPLFDATEEDIMCSIMVIVVETESQKTIGLEVAVGSDITIGDDFTITVTVTNKSTSKK